MESEFKSFGKIPRIEQLNMCITQKIHGTNAQLLIHRDENNNVLVNAGSRTRWLTPDDDNYGFAGWVERNKEELIEKLGEGRHYGEWCGKGINSGEGLPIKTLVLFEWWKFYEVLSPDRIYLMNNVRTVPLLYTGDFSYEVIDNIMLDLKTNGSKLLPPGFYMKPEGIVISINDVRYKKVFDNEEVKWKESVKVVRDKVDIDMTYLLQPIRLEKLLSRDESYIRDYPKSLSRICSDYVKDLEEENQFKATNEDDLKIEKKDLGRVLFYFVKSIVGK